MNWVDIAIAGVALGGLFIGWKMGLLGAIFNALGVVAGLFLAARFSDDIAAWITEQGASDAIATVLTYVVIIVGVFVAAQVGRATVKKMLSLVFLGWVDSLGSIAVGLLFGLALSGALILGLARFSTNVPEGGAGGLLEQVTGLRSTVQDALVESKLVPVFIQVTSAIPADAMGF
ncbi:MAG: CvpA family protein, partial [Chloroflexota bacterium]